MTKRTLKAWQKKWCDKSRAGYPVRIDFVGPEKLRGYYWYCGEWVQNYWYHHGGNTQDATFKMDIDLMPRTG